MSASTLQQQATSRTDEEHIIGRPADGSAFDRWSPKPSRRQTLRVIAAEYQTDHNQAAQFLDWLNRSIDECRTSSDGHKRLTRKERRKWHGMLTTLIPGNSASVPGSAHSIIELHLLDSSKGEIGIVHDMGAPGTPQNCAMGLRYVHA